MRKIMQIIVACVLPSIAQAMEFAAVSSAASPRDVVIVMTGGIVAGDADRFHRFLDGLGPRNRWDRIGIQIDSMGGITHEAENISKTVREREMTVTVMPEGLCASACIMILAAGVKRYSFFAAGVSIGVHSASTVGRGDDDNAKASTIRMARLLTTYGVPASIIGKMVITPQTDIVWLSASELQAMGVRLINLDALTPRQRASLDDLRRVSLDLSAGRLRPAVGEVVSIR